MQIRDRHKTPWRFKYGRLFDAFHWVEGPLARLFSKHGGKPAFHDSWGCPYWLYVEDGSWSLFSYRRKVGDAGISRCADAELIIEDIEIHSPRDRGLGLGSFLLGQILTYAQKNNMTRIVGRVTSDDVQANSKLLERYQGFGFRVERAAQEHDDSTVYITIDISG